MQRESPHRTARFIHFDRFLLRRGDAFVMEAQLELPPTLARQPFADLLEREIDELPSRTQLLLQQPDGRRRLVAMVSEVQTHDGLSMCLEPTVARDSLRFSGGAAAGSFFLWLGEGLDLSGPKNVCGGALPDALPWIFAAPEDPSSDRWPWLGSGSLSTRRPQLRVALAEGWRVEHGSAEAIGRLGDRILYQLSAPCRLGDDRDAFVVLRAGADSDRLDYRLAGQRQMFGSRPIFLGPPRVWVCDEEERALDAVISVQWRPVGESGFWREFQHHAPTGAADACLGRVWLRVIEDGALRWLEQVEVLPAGFEIGLQPGPTPAEGEIVLDNIAGARVALAADQPADQVAGEVRETTSDRATMVVRAPGVIPAQVELVLDWGAERRLVLPVPFPSRRALFVDRDGHSLAIDHQIASDRLSGIRAIAGTGHADEKFFINAQLVLPEEAMAQEVASAALQHLGHTEEIPQRGPGWFELDVGHLREVFLRLLIAADHLDASLHLRIESDRDVLPPCPIHVGRFDAPLVVDADRGLVELPDAAAGSESRVEAYPLWRPEDPPSVLERQSPGFGLAAVERQPGPWLLLGWEGDWCRFRPVVWQAGAGEAKKGAEAPREETLSAIQRALRLESVEERRSALTEGIEALAGDLADPGWAQVMACLERQSTLPAAVFELLRVLSSSSEAAVGALLLSSETQLARTWRTLQQYPFTWRLVPLRVWRRMADRFAAAQNGQGGDAVGAGNATRELLDRLARHRPFLRAVADWLRSAVLGEELSQELRFPLVVYEGVLEQERQDLMRRAAERWWPHSAVGFGDWLPRRDLPNTLRQQLQRTRDKPGYMHAMLQAPLLTAFACVLDRGPAPERFLFTIHRLREFDSRFFDNSFEFGLRLALSVALEEDWDTLR